MALTTIEPFGINSGNSFTFANVTATGNVTGNYFVGNGSQLTGLPESYSNANVAAYLPTYTGNLVSLTGNISTTGNITGNYFVGNFSGQASTAVTAGTVTDAAQPNITSVGTLTSVSVTGNVIAGNITGNGSGLTSITGANVTGTVANATYATSAGNATSATTADTVTTAAQPNITSVGTLSSVSVSGNIVGGNIATAGLITATGNITGSYFIGNGSQLTGLPESYSNANVAAYLPTYTGNLASLAGNVTTTANIGANYFLGNGSQLTSITGANVTGQVGNALVAGTVTDAAQPNITSVGTLSSVSVTGNVTSGNLITAGLTSTDTLQTSGNAIVGGNLIVNGNTVYINITELNVQDPIIGLGRGANNTPLTVNDGKDRGTEMWYYDTAERAAFVGLDNSTGKLIAAANVSIANEIVTVNSYGTFVAGAIESATVSATGNVSGNYFVGNGSQLTGLPEGYGNANVVTLLSAFGSNTISTTGNVTANYFLGNGSQLTGIQAGAVTTFSSTAPVSPAQGDVWIESDTGIQYIYFNDGTSSQWAEMEAAVSISSGGGGGNVDFESVSSNILPAADITYDLGSATHRWRDIYLSGNTINLGGATIKTDPASGAIALIPEPTEANPNPSGMVVSPSGGITVVSTTGGVVSGNAIAEAAESPTAAPVPIDITTTAPTNGQALIWDSSNSEFVPGNVSAGGATVSVYGNISGLPLSNVSTGSMAFVSSNNRLYLWNGTGWFNIALINTNPTITSGADPSYVFATDGTPIVLTLVASDPEGIPLTWSYEVTSGVLGNIATVSQADNVFTITPSTNDADGGTFQLTFSASDGVNIGTAASSFSLVFGAADPYYKQSVLLSTTSTNNGTNNVFVDSSTNNFTVTRNGNATQGTFGPFSPAGWSGYFDGTGDYLTIPDNTAFDFGTGDFTIECFVYATSFSAGFTDVIASTYQDSANGWTLGIFASTGKFYGALAGDSAQLNDPNSLILNSWVHLCLTRSSTTARFFVNGIQVASESNSTNMSSTSNVHIGTNVGGGSLNFNGYISNLRIVKGTAIYTANFEPPTEPLTAVSGTSLLTLHSNRFIDNSVNNFAITQNGDARIAPFSPFDPLTAYDTSVNGGSAYFDGTGDYLTMPSNAAFQFGTGDFTVECWIYKSSAANGPIIDARGVSNAVPYAFYVDASNFPYFYDGTIYASTVAILNSQWNHIVVVRTSGVLKIFVNGVQGYSASNSVALNPAATVYIGGQNFASPAYTTGYISNLRIVKGTAVYTAAFTPPTAPVTAIAGTSLLLNAINANIYDQTGKVVAETLGDAKTSTAVVKYGTTSMAFDGTGDYLLSPSDPIYNFPANFTIEMWINFANVNSTWQSIVSRAYGIAGGWRLYKNDGNNQLRWYSNVTSVVLTTGSTLQNNTWHHIAVVRNSGTITIYIDGINRGSAANTTNYTPGNYAIEIGSGVVTSAFPMTGYISDLRITNGVARYTTNFTPPTAQLGFSNPE
jgi:hypothetical protein